VQSGGEVFGWSGGSVSPGVREAFVMRYFPTVQTQGPRAQTRVVELGAMAAAGSRLALAGLDQERHLVLTSFDPATGAEQVLLGADQPVEIAHLVGVRGASSVIFHGVRFADGKHVLGVADLATGSVSMAPTGGSALPYLLAL
jgi:hypothetical protein